MTSVEGVEEEDVMEIEVDEDVWKEDKKIKILMYFFLDLKIYIYIEGLEYSFWISSKINVVAGKKIIKRKL